MLRNILDNDADEDDLASQLQASKSGDVVDYLHGKILAILVHFDNRLNNPSISIIDKTKVPPF